MKNRRPISVRLAVGFVLTAGLLAALSKLSVAWMTVTGRFMWTGGGADPRKPLEHLPQLLQADIREGSSFYLEDVSPWLRILAASPSVIYAITIALAAVLVARMLRAIASGDAFGTHVRRTLTRLSVTLVAGGVTHGAIDTAAVWAVSRNLTPMGRQPGDELLAIQGLGVDFPDWPAMLIVLGLVAAALHVAFRQGARLREEMDGVI